MVGYFAADHSIVGQRPGVLICHAGRGLSNDTREIADRIAAIGYSVFALDYLGDGKPPARETLMPRLNERLANPQMTRMLARAGFAIVRSGASEPR